MCIRTRLYIQVFWQWRRGRPNRFFRLLRRRPAAAATHTHKHTQSRRLLAFVSVSLCVCVFVCMWVSFCDPFWRPNARARVASLGDDAQNNDCAPPAADCCVTAASAAAEPCMLSIKCIRCTRETEANTQNCNLLSDAFAFYKRQRLHQQC